MIDLPVPIVASEKIIDESEGIILLRQDNLKEEMLFNTFSIFLFVYSNNFHIFSLITF